MGTTLLTYITVLVVVTTTPATRSQVGDLNVREYTGLLDAFEETLSAKTAARLVEFSHDSIRTASEDYRRSILVSNRDHGERRLAHKLKLAALLHTEASLLLNTQEDAFFHMDIAKGFLERLEDEGERRFLITRWCLAMGHYFQFRVIEPLASLPLEAALRLDPDNVEILLALGRVSETVGWMKKSSKQLERAEECYRKVIEIEPTKETAQVGLAHVLVLQENYDEALQLVEPLAGNTGENHLEVASFLVAGDIYKSQGRLAKAIRSYKRAVSIDPRCQSAAVALSHTLYLSGDIVGARDVMNELFTSANSATGETDSWWFYLKGDRRKYVGLLNEMREELSR